VAGGWWFVKSTSGWWLVAGGWWLAVTASGGCRL